MSLLEDQIRKARDRAAGIDLAALSAREDTPPATMASPQAQSERQQLLVQTYGRSAATDASFERLIAGNELQPINYLAHGVAAARPVCRLTLNDPAGRLCGYATGFMIAPTVLLTNNHVFPDTEASRRSIAEFDVELDIADQPKQAESFALAPDRLFLTSPDLDYALVAVAPQSANGRTLSDYGWLPLLDSPGKVIEGEWMTIIQHPGGGLKQVCVRENKLLARTNDVLWYSTDTLGGSSGSPVFNNDWQVVALHHKGVPETRNGVIQTIDGRDFDESRDDETAIKWIANEGIRISRMVDDLRRLAPNEPLLQPYLAPSPDAALAMIANMARRAPTGMVPPPIATATAPPASQTSSSDLRPAARSIAAMPTRSITLTLDIADDGSVAVREPAGSMPSSFTEAASAAPAAASRPPDYEVPFDSDYGPDGKREGYRSDFLGNGVEIPLPELGALAADATELITPDGDNRHVLNYRDYSAVMHATRKFAIFTAANIEGGKRFHLRRPHDIWRYDPRIPQSAQVGDYYYANNQFDRGHLTRYEDMQYGDDPTDALVRAADTLHFTNCTPQHAKFNQGKQLWQGLEQDVLEQSIEANTFRAIVMTAPVLDVGDPVWDRFKDIQYPLKFWKIAIALTSADKVFAAGFVLDQSAVIAQYGIEAVGAVPFAPFKTFQVPIAEIERLTGLTFKMTGGASLSDADPLSDSHIRRAALSRAGVATTEATSAGPVPYGYIPLSDASDIVRPPLG